MARMSSFSVAVVVAVVAACTTPSAARGTGPSTRVVIDGGVERRAEDVARELVAQADAETRSDRSGAKTAYRRVVDEFADTRARGAATVALARLLLAEAAPSSAVEARKWLERFLLDEPGADDADAARSLLSMAQLATGGGSSSSSSSSSITATVDKLPDAEKGPALVRLGRELVSGGKAKDGLTALLAALPRLSASERKAVEVDAAFALDVPVSQGGVPFSAVEGLRQQFSSDAFADELLLWKLARIKTHLGDDETGSALAGELIKRHPSGRYAAAARALQARLATRVQVDPKVIGVVLPLSGEFAAYGKRALVAIRLAFNLPVGKEPGDGADADAEVNSEVNAETGEVVPKKKAPEILVGTINVPGGIRLVVRDSGGRAETATAAVRDLVEGQHAIAILGDLLIETSLPVALACEDFGVPLISLARRDGVPEAGPWSFRLALTPKKQAQALVAYAVDGMKYKRFAIMHPKHAFGVEMMGHFWDALDARQAEVTAIESYALDQTTFTTEAKSLVGRGMASGSGKAVAECRDAARGIDNEYRRRKAMEGCGDRARPIIDFEAIFIPDSYKVVSFVIPALISEDVLLTNQKFAVEAYKKATGNDKVRPVQLLGVNTMNDPDLAERLGRQVDGAVFVDGFDPGDQTPLVQRFIEGFGRGMHSRPSLIEAQTYDAARLLGAVLEGQLPGQAGQKPATRGSVKRALDDVEGFVGVTGTISFDEQGDSVVPLSFFRLEREKVERVDVSDLIKGAG